MTYLNDLEEESIYILREVFAECNNPVILYSIGKDSSTLLHLAKKAFYPNDMPFKLMHVDTSYKFEEMYELRDQVSKTQKIIIWKNDVAIANNVNPKDYGTIFCCEQLKTKALCDAINFYQFDALIGGSRRDEEKSRAKEHIFSFRDQFGKWNPLEQRPEFLNIFNCKLKEKESWRVFPLSNWTELDIWHYIKQEKIKISTLYFAEERPTLMENKNIILTHKKNPQAKMKMIRFRSLGCVPCSGAIESTAKTVDDIIKELQTVKFSERTTRVIDHDQESSMECKKKEGYF